MSPAEVAERRPPLPLFLVLAAGLWLFAVAGEVVQKQYEAGVPVLMARTVDRGGHAEDCRAECERLEDNAAWWQRVNLSAALLALVAWGVALLRHESHRRLLGAVALLVYILLWFVVV
jgi:hypothetical protein